MSDSSGWERRTFSCLSGGRPAGKRGRRKLQIKAVGAFIKMSTVALPPLSVSFSLPGKKKKGRPNLGFTPNQQT